MAVELDVDVGFGASPARGAGGMLLFGDDLTGAMAFARGTAPGCGGGGASFAYAVVRVGSGCLRVVWTCGTLDVTAPVGAGTGAAPGAGAGGM